MPLVPIAPPVAVHTYGAFDYLAIDAPRRRVYAAHTGSRRLLIVDADTGKELGQVDVGPVHGVAVDPATGDVYTGDGTDDAVSKVDPVSQTVVATAGVGGPVDAIAYDPVLHRVYADEDSGTVVFVVDARTMKAAGEVALPGHDEEFLDIDPQSHVVFQNVPDLAEFVEIDPKTLRVFKVVHTPMLVKNHPLQLDPKLGEIVVGGKNGVLAVYTAGGKLLGRTPFPKGVDQCNLDRDTDVLACASEGVISTFKLRAKAGPAPLATLDLQRDAHTLAIDARTGTIWTAWAETDRDVVAGFRARPRS
jgi:hypothetical protein